MGNEEEEHVWEGWDDPLMVYAMDLAGEEVKVAGLFGSGVVTAWSRIHEDIFEKRMDEALGFLYRFTEEVEDGG
jgi:hypothetical protein